jgi:hypothetical protein
MFRQYYLGSCKNNTSQTDRRDRVVNTPSSYSVGPGSNLGQETDYPG